jgi:Skp family chaperone for outer membrane proteins
MASSLTVVWPAVIGGLLISATSAFAQARPAFPIAYISVQRILTEAEEAKAAAKQLENLRAAKTQELNAKKRALDETKLQLANAGGVFSSARRQQLTDLAKRQESELQLATQQAQTEFQDLQKTVQDRLREELSTIVTDLARQRGVQYVLNQDVSIVLAPAGANWTPEVLQRLNSKTAAQKTAPEKTSSEKTTPEKGASPAKEP